MQDEQYLAKLMTHWKRQAAFPPMAKLTGIVGLTSTSSVHAMVERLCEAGYLTKVDGRRTKEATLRGSGAWPCSRWPGPACFPG